MTGVPPASYLWPAGRVCAAAITIDVDAVTPMMWRLRHAPDYPAAEVEQRRFGIRQGVDRLLQILGDASARATFFVPGYIAESHPSLVRAMDVGGHEIGLHGYIHEDVNEIDEAEHREILRRCIGILGDALGRAPIGYRAPNWGMTEFLPDLLREHGVQYDSSLMGYDHPYSFHGLVELPVSWSADDAPYYFYLGGDGAAPPWPAGQIEQAWRDELAAALRFSSLLCLTVHPWMTARGHRAVVFERIVREIAGDASIWQARCEDIAAYHRQSPNRDRFVVNSEKDADANGR